MTLCVRTGGHCLCQPDEGVFCPNYRPDAYVQCLMDTITELLKAPPAAEAFQVIFHNMDSNGDPIGAQPETPWETGYAAGLRYAYRVLKERGVDLPPNEPARDPKAEYCKHGWDRRLSCSSCLQERPAYTPQGGGA